jgi:predicted nucleic acid-binding protein
MVAIVVDTDVLVAACLREGGSSRAVTERCLRGAYRPLIGAALFLEYEDWMSRDALFPRSPLTRAP